MRKSEKQKCGVAASVYPTPHTNAERIWLSSGRVPLTISSSNQNYLNVLVWRIRELINQEVNKVVEIVEVEE